MADDKLRARVPGCEAVVRKPHSSGNLAPASLGRIWEIRALPILGLLL